VTPIYEKLLLYKPNAFDNCTTFNFLKISILTLNTTVLTG